MENKTYILLKDLPWTKAGTEFTHAKDHPLYCFDGGEYWMSIYENFVQNHTEWFMEKSEWEKRPRDSDSIQMAINKLRIEISSETRRDKIEALEMHKNMLINILAEWDVNKTAIEFDSIMRTPRINFPNVNYRNWMETLFPKTLTQKEPFKIKPIKKKIIGYKCPMDMFKGMIKTGIPYEKENDYYVPQFKFSPDKHPELFYMPSEIVETWEPVYEEEKKLNLPVQASCFAQAQHDFDMAKMELANAKELYETACRQHGIENKEPGKPKRILDAVYAFIKTKMLSRECEQFIAEFEQRNGKLIDSEYTKDDLKKAFLSGRAGEYLNCVTCRHGERGAYDIDTTPKFKFSTFEDYHATI